MLKDHRVKDLVKDHVELLLSDTFGRHHWGGADSKCWRVGSYVYKLCSVSVEMWRVMRILSRRSGPYAEIIDMRVVGHTSTLIDGLIIQRYKQPNHLLYERGYSTDSWPRDLRHNLIPRQWTDGTTIWHQVDGGSYNAVGGVWVDLARIQPLNSRMMPSWLVSQREMACLSLEIRPLAV